MSLKDADLRPSSPGDALAELLRTLDDAQCGDEKGLPAAVEMIRRNPSVLMSLFDAYVDLHQEVIEIPVLMSAAEQRTSEAERKLHAIEAELEKAEAALSHYRDLSEVESRILDRLDELGEQVSKFKSHMERNIKDGVDDVKSAVSSWGCKL